MRSSPWVCFADGRFEAVVYKVSRCRKQSTWTFLKRNRSNLQEAPSNKLSANLIAMGNTKTQEVEWALESVRDVDYSSGFLFGELDTIRCDAKGQTEGQTYQRWFFIRAR
jgi:hypothetical protein